jgi:hypothetical protein
MHDRESAMRLHIGDIFLERFFPPNASGVNYAPSNRRHSGSVASSEHQLKTSSHSQTFDQK